MNRQHGSKMNKDVFRFQYLERGTKRKNWTQHLSYTINSHEAFDTADPCSSRDCVIYELNKRLTTLTVSLVIENVRKQNRMGWVLSKYPLYYSLD